MQTFGAYFGIKQVKVETKGVTLAVWDTAGEEKFDSLTSFYCRGARAALIVYDITDYDTFQGLERWMSKIRNQAEPTCAVILVGNKRT